MNRTRESPNTALAALTAEMMKPPIAASAQEAMHPEPDGTERKLVLINQDPFHGYACSWCGCRFPEIEVRTGGTLGENLLLIEAQRKKRFAKHVCSDRPHLKY